jgi:hypothetical protein
MHLEGGQAKHLSNSEAQFKKIELVERSLCPMQLFF